MARISKNKLTLELRIESLEFLFKRIEKIKSPKDLVWFLNEFFTVDEKDIVLRRLAVIVLLKQKKKYREIENFLEISKATISKAKQILSGDGYGRNLKKRVYSKSDSQPKRKERRKKFFRPYKGAESII